MPTSTLSRTPVPTSRRGPACASSPEVFQDPLVEDPPRGGLTKADRERQTRLVARARATCEGCPLRSACLYEAVVRHDVAGFVGGTRQIDHDEVLRLRRAHPDETLEQLAQRLGCSLSTIKRHLRRERREPAPRRTVTRPMPVQVLQVTAAVVTTPSTARAA